MLNQFIDVEVWSRNWEKKIYLVVHVNKTGKFHMLSGQQAKRVAKILYTEVRSQNVK